MTDREPERPSGEAPYPGAPAWVKVFLLALVVLLVAFVLATVLGMHTPGGPGGHGG